MDLKESGNRWNSRGKQSGKWILIIVLLILFSGFSYMSVVRPFRGRARYAVLERKGLEIARIVLKPLKEEIKDVTVWHGGQAYSIRFEAKGRSARLTEKPHALRYMPGREISGWLRNQHDEYTYDKLMLRLYFE